MVSSDGQRPPASGNDTIEPSDPALPQYAPAKQHSDDTNGHPTGIDEKKDSPVEQYGVDAEKQSDSVGSLHRTPSPDSRRRPYLELWHRHWKIVAELVTFMVFTASVSPSLLRHRFGAAYFSSIELTASAAADGGFMVSSSSATPMARVG